MKKGIQTKNGSSRKGKAIVLSNNCLLYSADLNKNKLELYKTSPTRKEKVVRVYDNGDTIVLGHEKLGMIEMDADTLAELYSALHLFINHNPGIIDKQNYIISEK